MSLPYTLVGLVAHNFDSCQIRKAILERRAAIRSHRDQIKDDRCHLDDYLVWKFIEGTPAEQDKLPTFDETMKLCKDFYNFRRTTSPDGMPLRAIRDKKLWDADLKDMLKNQLLRELLKIQLAILHHRDIGERHRTVTDDRLLYYVLPEKMPADFRLPARNDFLGEGKAPKAGCPAFIRSHDSCQKTLKCNLHAWGPCKSK